MLIHISPAQARGRWLVAAVIMLAAVSGCRQDRDTTPAVHHVNLSPHREWKVVSVQPYAGLEEVELVRVDWPTAQDARLAFALTREDLKTGDPVCLDHITEIDTLWAHPVPDGGCEARAPVR